MSTTTVRLDPDEAEMLADLAPRFGGKSGVLRQALRRLAEQEANQAALAQFVAEWNATDGSPTDEEVAAMVATFDH